MGNFKNVWIFAENLETLRELSAGGHILGEKVSAIVIGNNEAAEKVVKFGIDHIYLFDESGSLKIMEEYTPIILELLKKEKPELFLIFPTKRTKLLAGRLAAALRTSVLTDVMELVNDNNKALSKRMVYGGAAIRCEKIVTDTAIALVGPGVFEAQSEDTNYQGNIETIQLKASTTSIKRIELRKKVGESVNLSAAKKVVGIGRGLANQEDLKLINEFAGIIGAELGCSRPIAEGVNWMARERYIGVSGAILKPEIYFAVGISGQVQHMVGVNQAKTIVAINKDKAAPIFKQADYGIIGDLYKVLPELIQKLKK